MKNEKWIKQIQVTVDRELNLPPKTLNADIIVEKIITPADRPNARYTEPQYQITVKFHNGIEFKGHGFDSKYQLLYQSHALVESSDPEKLYKHLETLEDEIIDFLKQNGKQFNSEEILNSLGYEYQK